MSENSVFLTLNSKDCTNPQYPVWILNDSTLNNIGDARIRVHFAAFPNVVYPINEFNNTLTWFDTISRTTTVPPGSYTGSALATLLGTLMTHGANTITVTYDSAASYKYTFSGTANFYFIDGTLAPNVGITTFPQVLSATVTGNNPINIAGTAFVDVICSLGLRTYSSTLGNTTLCRIPVGDNFMNQIVWEPAYILEHKLFASTIHDIGINLQDDKGKPYILPANAYLSLVLEIAYVK